MPTDLANCVGCRHAKIDHEGPCQGNYDHRKGTGIVGFCCTDDGDYPAPFQAPYENRGGVSVEIEQWCRNPCSCPRFFARSHEFCPGCVLNEPKVPHDTKLIRVECVEHFVESWPDG